MSMPLVAIRPEPGLSATLERARAMGLDVMGYPLSQAVPCEWSLPDVAGIDGLLVGSANAFHHGGSQLQSLRHLPVLAVGGATARAARDAGFTVEFQGQGGLQQVLDGLDAQPRHLLRLSGEAHIALDRPDHIQLTEIVMYRVQYLGINTELEKFLRQEACVMLHSAGMAEHLGDEFQRLGIPRGNTRLVALGPRIAAAAGTGWGKVESAINPDDRHLLALARDMCQ